MKQDCKKIWENCLALIKQEVSPQSYKTWFACKHVVPYKYEKNTLTICVNNPVFYEWYEENYVDLLRRTLRKQIGAKGRLAYKFVGSEASLGNKNILTAQKFPKSVFPYNRMYLNPDFTFHNFVVGDSNQLAQASAQAVANNPGKTPFNPLVMYGKVGLGKTHIAQAVIHYIKTHQPHKSVLYITTENFTTQFIQKIRQNKIQEFTDAYSMLDVLVIDDIQSLRKKEKTQEMLFYIFNSLHRQGKQIIITSDVPPSDLIGFEKRLLSRFKWGLTVDLQKPDLETRIAIIHNKLTRKNFHLTEESIHCIATSITTNIREIEGVLVSLMGYADLKKKPVTLKIVQQAIDQIVSHSNKLDIELNIKYIQKTVAHYYKLPLAQIRSKSRKKEVVVPRQLIMFLARKYTQLSLISIAQALGYKDHGTVSYAFDVISKLVNMNKSFALQVKEIQEVITKDFPNVG